MKLSKNKLSVICFFIPFILYLSTLCPNLYWRDAGEFQVVAYQLGIAHPAGSPFYVLVTKIFTFLPFGSIAFKVNLASAFFGAVLICLIFLLINECLKWIFPSHHNKLWRVVSGALAASLYAVSNSLWQNSIVAEVYTLQNCFILLIALLLVRGIKQTEKKSCLYLAGFLFGLSAGAHIIMILYIPALLLFLWLFYRNSIRLSHLGIIIMFVILGASIYLYLPVRSSVNPYYDWGNPENVKNFIVHVTDKKDAKVHFFFSPKKFSQTLRQYGKFFYDDFGILGIVLGLTGIGVFFKKNPRLFLGLGAFFFSQWPFFIRYWKMPSAYIGTFIFFFLGIGVAFFVFIEKIKKMNLNKTIRWYSYHVVASIIGALCITYFFFFVRSNWIENNRSIYWNSYNFYHYLLKQIEYKACLMSINTYFGTSYVQQCENYRLDITNFLTTDILAPQIFNQVTQNRFPLVMIPPIKSPSIGEAIINMNIKNNRFYWEPIRRFNHIVEANLQPDGLLFYITASPQPISQESKKIHINKLKDFFNNNILGFSQPSDMEEKKMYCCLLENSSAIFFNKKEYPLAIHNLRAAEMLIPDDVAQMNALGAGYAAMGIFDQAEIYLKKTLDIFSSDILTLQNLGQLYRDIQQYDMALPIYKKILKKDPKNLKAHFGLGICYEKIGNLDKAHDSFQKVITLSPKDPLATEARKKLSLLAVH